MGKKNSQTIRYRVDLITTATMTTTTTTTMKTTTMTTTVTTRATTSTLLVRNTTSPYKGAAEQCAAFYGTKPRK